MKALLIRVAVDTTGTKRTEPFWSRFKPSHPNGGFWGPVWEDGRFEYVPVPEIDTDGKRAKDYLKGDGDEPTYGNARGDRLNRMLTDSISKRTRARRMRFENIAIHYDPDFKECTYGDTYSSKGQQCAYLEPDDVIVFCAPLEYADVRPEDRGLFIIGYFIVKEIHPFRDDKFKSRSLREKIVAEYWNKNAHFSASFSRAWKWDSREEMRSWYLNEKKQEKDDFILVIGKEPGTCSGLFKKAIRITEEHNGEYFYLKKDIAKGLSLGSPPDYKHMYNIGIRWVEDKACVKYLKQLLEKGGGFHQISKSR